MIGDLLIAIKEAEDKALKIVADAKEKAAKIEADTNIEIEKINSKFQDDVAKINIKTSSLIDEELPIAKIQLDVPQTKIDAAVKFITAEFSKRFPK